jgi:pyruvate,orthophosphate dikinase
LRGAIGAVFGSWNNERAIVYRQKYNIPNEWGTAVNVQAMVFGNTGNESCSGVAFTRDPATGEKVFYGEYLINAQGEDVVAGVRTPDPVATLQEKMPKAYRELEDVRAALEKHFREMQDFEFTVENGKLFMLQTRNGKRTGVAAVRIAVEMVKEKLITWQEAVARVPADQLSQLLTPIFDRKAIKHAEKSPPACPPAPARRRDAFISTRTRPKPKSPRARCSWCARKRRRKTFAACSPPKASSPRAAASVPMPRSWRARWARSASAAPARCTSITTNGTLTVGDRVFHKGDFLSIDGTSGEVYAGEVKTAPSEIVQVLIEKTLDPKESATYGIYAQLMDWADKLRRLQIRTNADQPDQVANAVAFGAQGVGLCRTEHMFFEGDRIDAVREMILADTKEGARNRRRQAPPLSAERFRRHLPFAQRTARHHPPPRSAAARVPAPDARAAGRTRQQARRAGRKSDAPRGRTCMSSTRCSVIAAAVSASSIPRFRRCRPGRSSRPPSRSRRKASRSSPRS